MSASYHYCDYCMQPVYAGQGVVCYRLDGSEVVKHADISVCEWEIRTNPDVVPEPAPVNAGVRELEPRTTGALDYERGWYR